MNLYLLTQQEANDYDTYDACIVAARDEESAKNINPGGDWGESHVSGFYGAWCSGPDKVTAKLIGKAVKGTAAGIVLASFNAG